MSNFSRSSPVSVFRVSFASMAGGVRQAPAPSLTNVAVKPLGAR
ncbi:hypothetical protein [Catenuloplanes niger]